MARATHVNRRYGRIRLQLDSPRSPYRMGCSKRVVAHRQVSRRAQAACRPGVMLGRPARPPGHGQRGLAEAQPRPAWRGPGGRRKALPCDRDLGLPASHAARPVVTARRVWSSASRRRRPRLRGSGPGLSQRPGGLVLERRAWVRSAGNVDAEGEAVVPHAIAAQAHHQQARSLQPVRHRQVAGVQRAQSQGLDER